MANEQLIETEQLEFLSESRLDEIVKEFVDRPENDEQRRIKMIVLSLVSDLRNCRSERDEHSRDAMNAELNLQTSERQLQHTREELERLKQFLKEEQQDLSDLHTNHVTMSKELEQVKAEKDALLGHIKSWHERTSLKYFKRKFASILSQYEVKHET